MVDDPYLMHMMKQMDIVPEPHDVGCVENLVLYDSSGSLVPRKIIREAYNFFNEILEKVNEELELLRRAAVSPKLSIGSIFRKQLEEHKSFNDLHESHKRLFHWFVADYEAQTMCVFNETSIETRLKRYSAKNYRIPGGLGQLPHALAFGPGYDPTLDIICESPIDQVIYHGTGIEVKSDGRSYHGGCIVLAIPLSSFKV